MRYYDLEDFLRISAVLNYQLSARQPNWNTVASIILEGKSVSPRDQDRFVEVLGFLARIYGKTKRDLGPVSVLHPIRATLLLSHASPAFTPLDLVTCLLHDTFEDFKPARAANADWIKGDRRFQSLLAGLPEGERERLIEHLHWLTREPAESYNHYIGHLLDQSRDVPEVVRVKLADRLDNTFDMRIDLHDPMQGVNFFQIMFQALFNDTYEGYRPEKPHHVKSVLNGAERLYQLFKNIVLMSLIRQRKVSRDPVIDLLFEALAKSSMTEAQRITLHVFGYHQTSVSALREILTDTIEYAQSGGFYAVTPVRAHRRLDGVLVSIFGRERDARRKQLQALYQDKPRMLEVALAFVVVFLNFLGSPGYYVRGISPEGLNPQTP